MKEIKKYAVRFHGGPMGSGKGIRAQLHLFDAGRRMVGAVNFYEPGLELPADTNDPHITISMHTDMLHATVDVLRNESPVYLSWQESLKNAYLGTSQELVGEGE